MFLDWLERRIDPFASFEDGRMPPKTVTGFAAFYLRPMRTALVMLFLVAVAAGTVEASLYLLMGWFIDLLNNADRAMILQDHGWKLGLAAMLLLVVRPFTIWLHEVMSNQLLVPQATNQVRWRTHLYTLGHSLSYFQPISPDGSPTGSCRSDRPCANWPWSSSIRFFTWRSTR